MCVPPSCPRKLARLNAEASGTSRVPTPTRRYVSRGSSQATPPETQLWGPLTLWTTCSELPASSKNKHTTTLDMLPMKPGAPQTQAGPVSEQICPVPSRPSAQGQHRSPRGSTTELKPEPAPETLSVHNACPPLSEQPWSQPASPVRACCAAILTSAANTGG